MEKQNKYQSIFETTIDGIILINDSGLIEDINLSALQLFGYEKEELIGKNVSCLMPSPDRENHDAYIDNYQTTRKPKIIGIGREVMGLKKNKKEFPFRLAVSEYQSFGNTFFTGIIHDLTKQKEQEQLVKRHAEKLEEMVEERTAILQQEITLKEAAQKALVASQKLYETIAINFPNGTITVLDLDLNIVFIEGSELHNLGFGTERLEGKSYIDLLPETARDPVNELLAEVVNGENKQYEFKQNDHVFKARCVPLYGEEGQVEQVLIVEINITKEKKAEEEIYNSLRKEKQLNELKSKFVSMASHEFRTPLSSILSSARLIERYPLEDQQDKRIRHVQKIGSNVKNLTMILNDFLSLEKIEDGIVHYQPETITTTAFFEGVVEEAEGLTKIEQDINLNLDPQIEHFECDLFLLRNMLNNLISNAIKYSDDEIEISTKKLPDNLMAIQVTDKGIGISKEDQERLFGRFYRASNAGNVQGTGLGLNIVKRYAQIMNAEITFESKLNEGSTFSIIIPHKQKA